MNKMKKFIAASVLAGLTAGFGVAVAGAAQDGSALSMSDQKQKPKLKGPLTGKTRPPIGGRVGAPHIQALEDLRRRGIRNQGNQKVPPHCKEDFESMMIQMRMKHQIFTGEVVLVTDGGSAGGEDSAYYEMRMFVEPDANGKIPDSGRKGSYTVVGLSLTDQPDNFSQDRVHTMDLSQPDPTPDELRGTGNKAIVPEGATCVLFSGNSGFPDGVAEKWWYQRFFQNPEFKRLSPKP